MKHLVSTLTLALISTWAAARVEFQGGPVLDSTVLSTHIQEVIIADRIFQVETQSVDLQNKTKDKVTETLRDSLGLPVTSESNIIDAKQEALEETTTTNLEAMETHYTTRIRDTLGQEYLDSYKQLLLTNQRIGFFDSVLKEYSKENSGELPLSERAAVQSKILLLKSDIMSAQLAQSIARNARAAIADAWKSMMREREEAVEKTKETGGF